MPKYPHLIFDLDGTLTDPLVGITRSVAYALESFGIHVQDTDSLSPFIGPPLKTSFQEFYHFDDEQCQAACRQYRAYFLERGWAENRLYHGIPSLLRALKGSGHRLYVATSKGEASARRILEHFRLVQFFDYVAGDTPRHRRPTKGDVIRYLLHRQGIPPGEGCLMIGDRRHDIEGARQAGLPSIGVAYGYGGREELENAGATHVVETVAELRQLLFGTKLR